jgi:hypothetical protein
MHVILMLWAQLRTVGTKYILVHQNLWCILSNICVRGVKMAAQLGQKPRVYIYRQKVGPPPRQTALTCLTHTTRALHTINSLTPLPPQSKL